MTTQISTLPEAPALTDSTAQFNTKAAAFVEALPTFRSEANALATEVNDASELAQAAQATAIAAANYAGEWSTLSGAKSVPLMTRHNDTFWILLQAVANVALQEPAAGSAYWAPAYGIVAGLPVARPVLLCDWANARYLDHRWSVTRASAAWRINERGLLEQVAAGVPRFHHDISTRQCYGLLCEFARTNNALHSRDLTNAAWVKTNMSAAKDQVGIDGVASSASRLTATSAGGFVLQSITSASAVRKLSAYVKRLVGSGIVNMTVDNGSTWVAVSPTSDWTRVEIPVQTLANPTIGFRLVSNADQIAVDVVQQEDAEDVSTPIVTTTVAVTRSAEVFSFSGAPLTAVYRQDELTLLVEMRYFGALIGSTATTNAVQIGDGTANNRVLLRVTRDTSSPVGPRWVVTTATVSVASSSGGTPVAGQLYRCVAGLKTNDGAFYRDGAADGTDSSMSLATFTSLGIGDTGSDANFAISRLALFAGRITNLQMAALTAA
jgi:hypothetical protein